MLSLDSQNHELSYIAKSQDLEIFKILKESMSAKAPGRPVFNEMMKMIMKAKPMPFSAGKLTV